MNPSPDPAPGSALPLPDSHVQGPSNWREALFTLFTARVHLIQAESGQLIEDLKKKAAFFALVGFFLFFAWAAIVAGGIGLISAANGWPWYWVALATGGGHLLLGILFLLAGKSEANPAFPHTKLEFKKDHAWIETLTKKRTSHH